jgi:hypothetical protein
MGRCLLDDYQDICSLYGSGYKPSKIEDTGTKPSMSFPFYENTVVMKKDKFNLYSAFAILAFSFIIACANTPNLVGKWKEIGKAATLELWEDGTFKAVDNQKMAVSGKYSLSEHGNIRFEIFRQGSPSEIVNGKYSFQGDILTFTSADGKEIQRYRRQK